MTLQVQESSPTSTSDRSPCQVKKKIYILTTPYTTCKPHTKVVRQPLVQNYTIIRTGDWPLFGHLPLKLLLWTFSCSEECKASLVACKNFSQHHIWQWRSGCKQEESESSFGLLCQQRLNKPALWQNPTAAVSSTKKGHRPQEMNCSRDNRQS